MKKWGVFFVSLVCAVWIAIAQPKPGATAPSFAPAKLPANVTAIAAVPNAAGLLKNNGLGQFSYTAILSTDQPKSAGTPAAGVSTLAAPSDHVHQAYTSTLQLISQSHDFFYTSSNGFWTGNAQATGTNNQPTVADANHQGLFQCRSHASNANSGYGMQTGTNQCILAGSERTNLVGRLDVVSGQREIFGWFSAYSAPTDPVNGLYFDVQDAVLRGVATKAGAGGGTTATSTTYTITAATYYRREIVVASSAASAMFNLYNDAGVLLWTSTVATNVPVVAMNHGFAASLASPAGVTIINTVDYIDILLNKGAQRGVLSSSTPISPEYFGFGAITTGGDAYSVVHVTNTDSSGAGSFAEAAATGNRRIVFDVGGTIALDDYVYIKSNTTVDGSTAPSPGITFTGHPIMLHNGTTGVHDIILKGFRHRAGWRVTEGVRNGDGTCITIWNNCYNVIVDHVSMSNYDDEALNIWTTCHDITVQNCLFGVGAWAGHKFTMLVGDKSSRVSIYRNLLTGAPEQRNPAIQYDDETHLVAPSITADVVNNVVWLPTVYGTGIYYGAKANVVGNYYYDTTHAASFNVSAKIFTDTNAVGFAYLANNYSKDGSTFATTSTTPASQGAPYAVDTYAQLTPTSAAVAITYVLANAGCRTGGLDATDAELIAAVTP